MMHARWSIVAPLILAACTGGGTSIVVGDASSTGQLDGGSPQDAAVGDAGVRTDAAAIDASTDGGTTPECSDLDEVRCTLTAGCVADYCLLCDCDGHFQGCRASEAAPLPCPELACIQPQCECHNLVEEACRAAADAFACTPVYCADCHDREPFFACAGPNETLGCPDIDCFWSCRSEQECTNASCLPPDTHPGCGACYSPSEECSSDGDCTEGSVCNLPICSCDGRRECQPGCRGAADCQQGEECSLGHCRPLSCVDAGCPWPFVCSIDGQCTRAACADDGDCAGFYCVNGRCHDGLGVCHPPVP